MEYKICPSLLAADFMSLGKAVHELALAGCDYLHLDVMDGNFVPQISFGEKLLNDARKIFAGTIDSHLMVEHPGQHFEVMAKAGADIIIPHGESFAEVRDAALAVKQILSLGKKAGIAVDGPTDDIDALLDILPSLHVVLVATGKVGKAGQAIRMSCLDKVRKLRLMPGGDKVNIMVDIGINKDTITSARQSGANWFVAGSAIFRHPEGIKAGFRELADRISQ